MVGTMEDLTRAIGQAKKDGDLELAKKLEGRLDRLLDGPVESPKAASAPEPSGTWVDEVEGLGAVRMDASELPKRSPRDAQLANDYFNEGANQYAADEERFKDLMGGFDEEIEDFPG